MLPTDWGNRATISARTGASSADAADINRLAANAASGRILFFT
jgi:hypothetical protein